jgi:MFS transporter, CP family, cyanate transporter
MPVFSHTDDNQTHSSAVWVILCGVAAAMHIGKMPALLPLIADEMQLSRLQTGWLLALFQVAGMLLGLLGGLLADQWGRRRLMIFGLLLSAAASFMAPVFVQKGSESGIYWLLIFRAIESFGFLATVLPGPGLLQRLLTANKLRGYMGWWAAYMPLGMCLGLVAAPLLSISYGWRGVWVAVAVLNVLLAGMVVRQVPSDKALIATRPITENHGTTLSLGFLIRATLGALGPWLLAGLFLFYAAQWMSLFGFLPTIYREEGLSAQAAAWLTASAVLANVVGNVAAGASFNRLSEPTVVVLAASVMVICAAFIFGNAGQVLATPIPFPFRYLAVVLFSMSGGMIPGVIFGLVHRLAPALPNGEKAIGTTTGMFQQGSACGQVLVPPLVAWVVQSTGLWSSAWWVFLILGLGCAAIAACLRSLLRSNRPSAHR